MKFEAVVKTEKVWVFQVEAKSTEDARFAADNTAQKIEPTESKRTAQVYQIEEYTEDGAKTMVMNVETGCGCGGNCNCGKEH